jgi:hypothetical protein
VRQIKKRIYGGAILISNNSSTKSGQSGLNILKVDEEANTIELQVNGCHVTVVCKPEPDLNIYSDIKHLLLGSICSRL